MSKIVTVTTTWVHDYNLADYPGDFDGMTDEQIKQQLTFDSLDAIGQGGGGDPHSLTVVITDDQEVTA